MEQGNAQLGAKKKGDREYSTIDIDTTNNIGGEKNISCFTFKKIITNS